MVTRPRTRWKATAITTAITERTGTPKNVGRVLPFKALAVVGTRRGVLALDLVIASNAAIDLDRALRWIVVGLQLQLQELARKTSRDRDLRTAGIVAIAADHLLDPQRPDGAPDLVLGRTRVVVNG